MHKLLLALLLAGALLAAAEPKLAGWEDKDNAKTKSKDIEALLANEVRLSLRGGQGALWAACLALGEGLRGCAAARRGGLRVGHRTHPAAIEVPPLPYVPYRRPPTRAP